MSGPRQIISADHYSMLCDISKTPFRLEAKSSTYDFRVRAVPSWLRMSHLNQSKFPSESTPPSSRSLWIPETTPFDDISCADTLETLQVSSGATRCVQWFLSLVPLRDCQALDADEALRWGPII